MRFFSFLQTSKAKYNMKGFFKINLREGVYHQVKYKPYERTL